MKNSKPIGVFDSGLGGLTVVKELLKNLPSENIVYFGDTARVPYGTKSKKTIEKFSCQNALFLIKEGVKVIVIACNTSSSLALGLLKRTFKIPIIGVIESGARQAVSKTSSGRIGIIGTRATIASGVYQKTLTAYDRKIKVFAASCPLFVPLVEEGWLDEDVTETVAARYLKPLTDKKIDTLILGCTHYPLLKKTISKVMGQKVRLVDSAEAVAYDVRNVLKKEGLLFAGAQNKSKCRFFVSDEPRIFLKEGSKFLGTEITNIKRINNV